MRMHFISRLALLLMAGFLVVATQVWTGDTLQWMFIIGGAVMILVAAIDMTTPGRDQQGLDGLLGLLGAWTVVEAIIFEANDLKWWSFASAVALVGLATIGLAMHERDVEHAAQRMDVGDMPGGKTPLASA